MDIKTKINLISKPDSNLKAFVDVNLGGEFAVKGLRVIDGEKGLFVAMPSRSTGENKYEDIFFPITAESREKLHTTILNDYEKKLEQAQKQEQEEGQNNDKGPKGSKKGQSGGKSQKADDAPEQNNDDLSEGGQEEEIEEGPAMSM